ncbi:MAG: hypothetical protein AB8I08_01910 [Sandaracinaceae bacterium]
MAPERLRGDPIDPRCDVYSVAVCLHLAVHGVLPPTGGEPLRSMFEVDPLLAALIERGLAPDKDLRFEDASAMAMALQLWLDTAAVKSAPTATTRLDSGHPTLAASVEAPEARSRWAPLAAFAFVGLMGAFLAWRVASPLAASSKVQTDTGREARDEAPPTARETSIPGEADSPTEVNSSTEVGAAVASTAETEPEPPRRSEADVAVAQERSPRPTSRRDRARSRRSGATSPSARGTDESPPTAPLPSVTPPPVEPPPPSRSRSRPRPSLLEAPIEPDWSRARRR